MDLMHSRGEMDDNLACAQCLPPIGIHPQGTMREVDRSRPGPPCRYNTGFAFHKLPA
jgi:hypothetical protein